MRFCLCIFESNTVKSDCPENDKIFKDLTQTVGFPVSGDIKKKALKISKKKKKKKKSSENDQLTGHFQSIFIYFFCPSDPKSEIFFP